MNLLEILTASALLTLLLSQSYKNSEQISAIKKETLIQDKEFFILKEIKERFGFYNYSEELLLENLKEPTNNLEDINCKMISKSKLCFKCKANFRKNIKKNIVKKVYFCEKY